MKNSVCVSVVLYSNFTLKPKLSLVFRGGKSSIDLNYQME